MLINFQVFLFELPIVLHSQMNWWPVLSANFRCLLVLWFGVWLLCNVLNVEFWWQSDSPVHQLWPPSGGKQSTELDVVLFHGLQLTANDTIDAWSSTWTQRGHDDVCWAQEWLPFDLGEAVRIFSVSYNAHVVTSPHDHVSEIAHNLFQNLMNQRYKVTSLSLSKWHAWANAVVHSQICQATKTFRYEI
jgi:hypothetical protein